MEEESRSPMFLYIDRYIDIDVFIHRYRYRCIYIHAVVSGIVPDMIWDQFGVVRNGKVTS